MSFSARAALWRHQECGRISAWYVRGNSAQLCRKGA